MRGAEAIAKIRSQLPKTKVIVVTAVDTVAVLADCIDAGCSGFIAKDSPPAQVLTAIRAAAAGEALVPDRLTDLLHGLRSPVSGAPYDLTGRELEVLTLLAQGETNQMIADELFISVNTVRNHVQHVIAKLGAHSKLEAVATAVREGIVDMEQVQSGGRIGS
jgi:DNA-binding NarL/FixJ family response regulator